MRYEATNARRTRFPEKIFYIDVIAVPNWFERVILRQKRYTRIYKGPVVTDGRHEWFRADGDKFFVEHDKDIILLIDLEYYFFHNPKAQKAVEKLLKSEA